MRELCTRKTFHKRKDLYNTSLLRSNYRECGAIRTTIYKLNQTLDKEGRVVESEFLPVQDSIENHIVWGNSRISEPSFLGPKLAALDALRLFDFEIANYKLKVTPGFNNCGEANYDVSIMPLDEEDFGKDTGPTMTFKYRTPPKSRKRKGIDSLVSELEIDSHSTKLILNHGNYYKEIAGKKSKVKVYHEMLGKWKKIQRYYFEGKR